MGIYIPGIEMPRACGECSFEHNSLYICTITGCCTVESRSKWERMPNCPIIELSQHGLKPCPFCGGEAIMRNVSYNYIDGAHLGKSVIAHENKDHEEFFVYCTKCRVMQYLTYKTPEEAAKNWNERR